MLFKSAPSLSLRGSVHQQSSIVNLAIGDSLGGERISIPFATKFYQFEKKGLAQIYIARAFRSREPNLNFRRPFPQGFVFK